MIDPVLNDLKETKNNIKKFHQLFRFASDLVESVGVCPLTPRTTKHWSQLRSNVVITDTGSYYQSERGILIMDALINNSHKFMLDRNQFVWHTSLSFSIAKI